MLLWLKRGLVLTSLVLIALPIGEVASMVVFGLLLVLFGIPHGALDHVLFRNQFQGSLRQQNLYFYGFYFLWIGVFAALWWLLPHVAMLGFLLVSGYHFGQTQLTHLALPKWVQFAWGSWVVALLMYLHPDALTWGFTDVYATIPLETLKRGAGYIAFTLFGCTWIGLLAHQADRGRELALELAEMGAIYLLFASTNFYLSFGLFFGGWHALRALLNLRHELRMATHETASFGQLLREAIPHSVASMGGIALLTALAYYAGTGVNPALFLFISLSVVALPHIAMVERWNRFLRPRRAPQAA